MKIGILCAGDRKAAPFIPILENDRVSEKAMLKFHEGTINGTKVVTLYPVCAR